MSWSPLQDSDNDHSFPRSGDACLTRRSVTAKQLQSPGFEEEIVSLCIAPTSEVR